MTPATQAVVLTALDNALAAHVARLFAILAVTERSANGLTIFWGGLNRAIGIHEEVRQTLEADDSDVLPEE